MRPKCRRQMLNLERGVGFSKDRFTVAQNDQFADSLGPQMKAIRSLGSGKDGLDSFEPSKNSRRGLGVSGRAKPYVTRAAEGAVVLDIFVALGGEGKLQFEAAILASLGEIPTTRLGVHAVVGRDQERRIRRCSDRTAKQDVKPSEMIFRLRCRSRPGVHRVVGRVNIEATQVWAILEWWLGGNIPEPVVDLSAVDGWWCSYLNLFGGRGLGSDGESREFLASRATVFFLAVSRADLTPRVAARSKRVERSK